MRPWAAFSPLSVSQMPPSGSGTRLPASVRVLTAAFPRPLPSPGHLLLGPHASLSPAPYAMESSWSPWPSLDCALSLAPLPKRQGLLAPAFPADRFPHPEEGGEVSSCCRGQCQHMASSSFPLVSWKSQVAGWCPLFSPAGPALVLVHMLSRVRFLVTPRTVARHAPLSVGFFRQEYYSGLPFPPAGDLPDSGVEPASLASPALAGSFFTTSTTCEALWIIHGSSLVWGSASWLPLIPCQHGLPAPPPLCITSDATSAPLITTPRCSLSSDGSATPQMSLLRTAPPWKKETWNSLLWQQSSFCTLPPCTIAYSQLAEIGSLYSLGILL